MAKCLQRSISKPFIVRRFDKFPNQNHSLVHRRKSSTRSKRTVESDEAGQPEDRKFLRIDLSI